MTTVRIIFNNCYIKCNRTAYMSEFRNYLEFKDADTELIHFGARDYDSRIGRWTTKDPIGFASGDTNLYAYVGGNPMSFNDPSGLKTVVRSFSGNAGHVAISVENSPFIGFYPDDSLLGILFSVHGQNRNDSLRADKDIDVVFDTTPEQEKAILAALLKNQGKPYSVVGPNCATRAADALNAGGIGANRDEFIPAIFTRRLKTEQFIRRLLHGSY